MKFSTVFSAMTLSAILSAHVFAKEANLVTLYYIDVTNAHQDDSQGVTKRVADFLKKSHLSDGCIDLRETASHRSGATLRHGIEGLLTNTKIPDHKLEELKKEICQGYLGCRVEITLQSEPTESLSINSSGFEIAKNGSNSSEMSQFSLAKSGPLPTFSVACVTGKKADSWNNAASPKEARKYLKELGLNIHGASMIDLTTSSGESLWTFGFPDHKNDGPVAEEIVKGKAIYDSGKAE